MKSSMMKKGLIVALMLMVLLPSIAEAQRWKRFRRQVIGGVGVTNFLGDLGGANQIGRDFVYDLDFQSTRPSLIVGYRYQFNSYFFGRANLQWGILRSDDDLTEQVHRNSRNLSFRSGFLELDLLAEFYLIQNARGNLYRLKGVRGRRGLKMDVYIYGGLGFMYFNPKAEYQGTWVALQPLGTEGQGLPGEPDKYRRTTFTVPYGIGIGKSLDRYWQINIEFTARMTFTDYIDDVSTTYYGQERLRQAYDGRLSPADLDRLVTLSDRNTFVSNDGTTRPDLEGEIRGDPTDNDAFMTGMITIARKIVKRRRSRPKF